MLISRRLRNVVNAGLLILLLCGGLGMANSSRRASDGLLRIVPAKSLFCVRINKFENTIEAANDFLEEVAPASFDAETEVLSKLGKAKLGFTKLEDTKLEESNKGISKLGILNI